jgi:hypothetical protein
MKNFLRDQNGKIGREGIFKLTVWNESVHGANNDNSVRTVNFASSKTNFQDHNISMSKYS